MATSRPHAAHCRSARVSRGMRRAHASAFCCIQRDDSGWREPRAKGSGCVLFGVCRKERLRLVPWDLRGVCARRMASEALTLTDLQGEAVSEATASEGEGAGAGAGVVESWRGGGRGAGRGEAKARCGGALAASPLLRGCACCVAPEVLTLTDLELCFLPPVASSEPEARRALARLWPASCRRALLAARRVLQAGTLDPGASAELLRLLQARLDELCAPPEFIAVEGGLGGDFGVMSGARPPSLLTAMECSPWPQRDL